MAEPNLKVLGAYRLNVTKPLVRQQFLELYNYEMTELERRNAILQCIEQLHSVVLLDVSVSSADENFRVSDFTQRIEGLPRSRWQAAWAEVFLTSDGKSILGEPPKNIDFRVAFFLHFFQAGQPLLCSYGELQCPDTEDMPSSLERLVPYIILD